MAKKWKNIRAEAVEAGRIDEDQVSEHRDRMIKQVRAARLADLRKDAQLTQKELAEIMHVDQGRISRLERGELHATELGSLKRYVEALGGELHLVATLGGKSIRVG